MHLLNSPNISMKWDVARSDAFYTVFHTHDLKEGSRTEQELEPAQALLFRKMHFSVKFDIWESKAGESCTDKRLFHL